VLRLAGGRGGGAGGGRSREKWLCISYRRRFPFGVGAVHYTVTSGRLR